MPAASEERWVFMDEPGDTGYYVVVVADLTTVDARRWPRVARVLSHDEAKTICEAHNYGSHTIGKKE